jgi:hypothetical protein
VQVPGKASGRREKKSNLSLSCCIEQIQSVGIGFVNREFRQCESAELVKMFLGPDLHVLELPNFFEPLNTLYHGYDLSD